MRINEIGKILEAQGVFTGGPPELFESAGRLQISTLIREGLNPDSKLLDVGCGCLRAGYWLVRFLDPECYFGIEPNQQMLEAGIKNCLTPQLVLESVFRHELQIRFLRLRRQIRCSAGAFHLESRFQAADRNHAGQLLRKLQPWRFFSYVLHSGQAVGVGGLPGRQVDWPLPSK